MTPSGIEPTTYRLNLKYYMDIYLGGGGGALRKDMKNISQCSLSTGHNVNTGNSL